MRRLLLPTLMLLLSAMAFGPMGVAQAATRKPVPVITKVSPMRVAVGRKITLRGKRFSSVRRRNTVLFRGPTGRAAFAKPVRASRTKIVVKVPGSVERLLTKVGTKRIPTRFKLRVVANRRYGKLTIRRRSPVIVSAASAGGVGGIQTVTCGTGSDFDGDLMSNAREASLGTDPCLKDTDGDGAEDYFEVESALDLNQRAVPYPGKRPFTNALDPSDGGSDYDGDGLTNAEESRAWAHPVTGPNGGGLQAYSGSLRAPAFAGPYGGISRFGGHSADLNYSDGSQQTVPASNGEYRTYLDLDRDGRLTDDERDADGDGLRNVDEIRLLMSQGHYPTGKECGYEYRPLLPRNLAGVDYLVSDVDGDGVLDGNDDQDTDGVSNVDEVQPPFQECQNARPLPVDGARDGQPALRNPFNPCLPDPNSDTCRRYGIRE